MNIVSFLIRAGVYILAFVVTWYAMNAVDYEKILKKGHTSEAQVLYFLIVMALSYLVGSFVLAFIYQKI